MKKSTKLLSVILAIVMIFSSLSVLASAHESYGKGDLDEYTTNDKGLSTLLTDEQRASWLCDLVNNLLLSLNIKTKVATINIDFTSLDAVCDTIDGLKGAIGALGIGFDLGILENLNYDGITKDVTIQGANGAVNTLNVLLQFLDNNAETLSNVIGGGLSLGMLSGVVNLSSINEILVNLDDFLRETVYGLGTRKLTNGIGDDPAWPNSPAWTTNAKTMDEIVEDLLVKVLTEPNHTTRITDSTQNLICVNPEAYGATAAMIHTEAATDGSGDTWYYIYGTENKGEWRFTENSTVADGSDKHYIMRWDEGSSLVKNFDTSVIDFTGQSLYELVGKLLPWAYETFGATNLDGQLRATLMQFTGAYNDSTKVDEATKATLQAKLEAKKAIQDEGTKAALGDAFDAEVGAAGNYNFAYFSLSGKNINDKPDDLYYVVEWDGNYEFYKVDFAGVTGEKLAMFETINWEYQAPGTYAELMPAGFDATAKSSLENITDAIGKILATAVKDLEWAYDSASENNAHFEDNLMKLVRKYLKLAPELIFGVDDAYKIENIDALTDEQVVTVLGADIMTWLMPALVLPEDVSCLEELLVYGVREFIAEIMPQYSWDAKIEAATTDADFLNIALDMGTSIGVYYLREVMALGTKTDGNGVTTTDNLQAYLEPSANCETGWNNKLNYVVDQVIAMWLPDLASDIIADNASAFNGTDGLLKLTAVLNTLFPGILSLVSGCNANGYACDLGTVKDLIAGILNLKIEPIAAKLYRNDTGYGNKSVYNAVVSLLKDLTKGIGFDASNDYENLVAQLDQALASTTPLDTLIQNNNLKVTARNLIWCLTDTATRNLWVQNLLLILMQVTGQMDDMSYTGANVQTDSVYYGSSVTLKPAVTVSTTGIPSVWYQGGYRTGEATKDGAYSAVLKKFVVKNFDNAEIKSVDVNATLTLNATYNSTSFDLTPTADMEIYTLETYLEITTPDGVVINGGEPVKVVTQFMMTAANQGDDTAAQIIDDGDDNIDTAFWNIYIDENEPLVKAEQYEMTVYNKENGVLASSRTFYIDGYGYNVTFEDGSIGRSANSDGTGTPPAGSATWTKYINTSTTPITVESAVNCGIPFFWNWNTREGGNGAIGKNSSAKGQQWVVDPNMTRDNFPDDFTTMKFSSNKAVIDAGRFSKGNPWKFNPPYIVIYNSYNLLNLINRELASGKMEANYTADSWATYRDALRAAVAEYYQPRKASTFAQDHTNAEGVSEFKVCADALTAAVENLTTVTTSASTATDYTAEEKEFLADLKAVLDTESDKHLNNQDYIMYRWLMYHDEYSALWRTYNGTVIPSGVAQDKLVGVPSDNATIDEVVAAADANKQGAISAMRVAPTAEEQAQAAQAKTDFTANLPTIDMSEISVDKAQLQRYASRLIAKSSNMQYLTAALTLVAGAQQADYTAESWAEFAEAKAAAQAITASNKPSEIHKARYNLLVAYKGLLPADTDVDLTALQEKMNFVETIFANPDLFKPSTAAIDAGYDTLDKAMAEVLKEAGAKVTVGEDVYYVGGNDTGAAWLDEAGMRTAKEAQKTVDRVVNEIATALAYVESVFQVVPDKTVEGNTTEVTQSLVIDGIKPGSLNSEAALRDLITTSVPQGSGYTAELAVTASAAVGFGTGTKVALTVKEVPGLVITHTVMVYGDVNGDGAVDAFDAALLDLHITSTKLADDFAAAADATGDAEVNAADYSMIANCAVGVDAINQAR